MELDRRNPEKVMDRGHNPQCMEALAASLARLYPGKKIRFLIGVLADKDYPDMLSRLLPMSHSFYTITPDSPRALSAQDLASYLPGQGGRAVACANTREGLEMALAQAGLEDIVCACGSLYMLGEVRHLLGLC